MKIKRNRYAKNQNLTPSAEDVRTEPLDSFQMVNKYGTYNIQPTADTENLFPEIAQGLPKRKDKHK